MKRWLTLGILVVIFALPGFLAILYFTHPDWLTRLATTNKGAWVREGWQYPALADSGKAWTMVIVAPQGCDAGCEKALDKVLRVRTALGRHWYDIAVTVLSWKTFKLPNSALAANVQTERVRWLRVNPSAWIGKAPPAQTGVFLADKQGRFILRYPITFKPAHLFADSKRLLSVGQSAQ